METTRNLDDLLTALSKSAFRARQKLRPDELAYFHNKGPEEIARHAADFIEKRLAPATPRNDGKQTPYRSHPVFVAQHATATCCRGCLLKWHRIPKDIELTTEQQEYVAGVIMQWLHRQSTRD